MRPDLPALGLLSAMITPAVLISACGALIFSTSSRLARIVDRARKLAVQVESLAAGEIKDFPAERRAQVDPIILKAPVLARGSSSTAQGRRFLDRC